jgi:ABC-type Mn2+/Zn2+ transport system permease subunit
MNFLAVMALPLLACVLLVLILPALGRHVLARRDLVDPALAQIALGQSVAFLLEPITTRHYYWSFGFTLLGAALFSFLGIASTRCCRRRSSASRSRSRRPPLLMLSNAPHGAGSERDAERRGAGWVTWKDITIMAVLFAIVGAFLFINRMKLRLCSEDPKKARDGPSVKRWDSSTPRSDSSSRAP